MHWTRLVLGKGHPIIIVVALALVGAGICWYSLQKIASLTKTPTRYTFELIATTEGCGEREFRLNGDIGSFGPSSLGIWFLGDDDKPVLTNGCRLRSLSLMSNLHLQPMDIGGSSQLIRVSGTKVEDLEALADRDRNAFAPHTLETVRATIVGGSLEVREQPRDPEIGPTFSTGVEKSTSLMGVEESNIRYSVTFRDGWQPILASFSFVVPENVRTYFSIFAFQGERVDPALDGLAAVGSFDISVSFRTDEVSVVRGSISDSGDAKGIDGHVQFGIENNDAESRRESGNVTYSAVLGIGIALLVEAFVILLALAVRGMVARLPTTKGSANT